MYSKFPGSRLQSLSVKIPLLMVGLAALAILSVGALAYVITKTEIEHEAQARLTNVLETRKSAIETWFESQIVDLQTLAGNSSSQAALSNFAFAWKALGAADGERRAYLHEHYIDANPHQAGERNQLETAGDGSTYSDAHQRYHAGFDQFRKAKGLYDIFLIDPSGNIIYSVFKEDDLGENLMSGRLADSGLAKAARGVLQNPEEGRTVFTDFAPYAPSYGAPASFIAAPVFGRNGDFAGALAFQLPIDRLNAVMRDASGLGETGQAYILGDDNLMRTAARFTGDDTVLNRAVTGPIVDAALAGTSGVGITTGLNGERVEIAAAPFEVAGQPFAVVVEQDMAELLAPVDRLTLKMAAAALAALLLASLLCILFGRSIAKPLKTLAGNISELANRNWDVQFGAINRGDEIGTIARGLKQLRYDLNDYDAKAEVARLHAAALARSSSGVMLADADFNVTYFNDSLRQMIGDNIAAFRGISPEIDIDSLVGMSIDVFHKNPRRIRDMLTDPGRLPMTTAIPVGDMTFSLDVSNVQDDEGRTTGFVVEWADATKALRNQEIVDRLRAALAKLSDGDLTAALDDGFDGEYAQLREDFNAAIQTLGDAISTVIDTSVTIKGEAHEISNAADDLARRTEQQAATLEQTAAALDQLTSSVGSAATSANEANRIVSAARGEAEESGKIVREAVSAMHEIDASSAQVTQIISVIEEIAFQTNLLALNAGVEAARAGEAGRGFAVVASEVRALARRSSDAAKEITGLVQGSTHQVKRGVTLVEKAGEALTRIVGSVQDIDGRVSDIAQSAQEQSSGLSEINIAVNQLDQVTQQNAAMFEEMSAASQSLNAESQVLLDRTGIFSVPPASKARPEDQAEQAPAAKQAFSSVRKQTPATKAGPGAAPRARPVKAIAAAVGTAPRKLAVEDDWDEF